MSDDARKRSRRERVPFLGGKDAHRFIRLTFLDHKTSARAAQGAELDWITAGEPASRAFDSTEEARRSKARGESRAIVSGSTVAAISLDDYGREVKENLADVIPVITVTGDELTRRLAPPRRTSRHNRRILCRSGVTYRYQADLPARERNPPRIERGNGRLDDRSRFVRAAGRGANRGPNYLLRSPSNVEGPMPPSNSGQSRRRGTS